MNVSFEAKIPELDKMFEEGLINYNDIITVIYKALVELTQVNK